MLLCRSGDAIQIAAPAKINLFLEVLGKRPDGFHELETLMVTVGLFDTLRARATVDRRIVLRCTWAGGWRATLKSGLPLLPAPASNLAYRAVEKLQTHAGCDRGLELDLVKRIPLEAGLGGASSDAAAALVAANLCWGLGMSHLQLTAIAAELGSDVPFFLHSGAAVCRGRGEQVEPLASFPPLDVVLVKPPAGLSTAAVYQNYRSLEPKRSAAHLIQRIRQGRPPGPELYNALERPAKGLSPWIERVQSEFGRLGIEASRMSGSGTSCYGICRNRRQARRVADQLRARRCGSVYCLSNIPRGTTLNQVAMICEPDAQ